MRGRGRNCEREGKEEWSVPRPLLNSLWISAGGRMRTVFSFGTRVQTKERLRQFSASLLLLDSEKLDKEVPPGEVGKTFTYLLIYYYCCLKHFNFFQLLLSLFHREGTQGINR